MQSGRCFACTCVCVCVYVCVCVLNSVAHVIGFCFVFEEGGGHHDVEKNEQQQIKQETGVKTHNQKDS